MQEDVQRFYRDLGAGEWDRLEGPLARLEFLSTMRMLGQYFPSGGRVVDIGSGPGRYSRELLRSGYRVTLLDLTPELLADAEQRLAAEDLRADAFVVGDARDLRALADDAFDGALLMGPLYHLADGADRLRALREARRVLRADGVLAAVYLNGWGLMRTGLVDFPHCFADDAFVRSMLGESGLDIWHWSNPLAARSELEHAGFEVVAYAGLEGYANGMTRALTALLESDPQAYDGAIRAAVDSIELLQYRDASDHLLFICRRA